MQTNLTLEDTVVDKIKKCFYDYKLSDIKDKLTKRLCHLMTHFVMAHILSGEEWQTISDLRINIELLDSDYEYFADPILDDWNEEYTNNTDMKPWGDEYAIYCLSGICMDILLNNSFDPENDDIKEAGNAYEKYKKAGGKEERVGFLNRNFQRAMNIMLNRIPEIMTCVDYYIETGRLTTYEAKKILGLPITKFNM